jgi:YebC/PmpR family DNA-binding regulatory protein
MSEWKDCRSDHSRLHGRAERQVGLAVRTRTKMTGWFLACAVALFGITWSSATWAKVSLVFGTYSSDKPSAMVAQLRPSLDDIALSIAKILGEEVEINMKVVRAYDDGVALIVEALTDNRNRTASEVRTAFGKHGGALAETNAVSFMFDRVGLIALDAGVGSADEVFEAAVEAGADNVESAGDGHEITCDPDEFNTVRDVLAARFGDPREAHLAWKPQNTVMVEEKHAETLLKLLDVLDDNDDVQQVAANFEIADEVMARLMA